MESKSVKYSTLGGGSRLESGEYHDGAQVAFDLGAGRAQRRCPRDCKGLKLNQNQRAWFFQGYDSVPAVQPHEREEALSNA
jgi:hypothetical protein